MKLAFTGPAKDSDGTVVVFSFKNKALSKEAAALDEKMGGRLKRAFKSSRFDGGSGEVLEFLAPDGVEASRILLVGLGEAKSCTRHQLEKAGAAIAARLQISGESSVTILSNGLDAGGLSDRETGDALALGALLRSYRFDRYRTKEPESKKPTLKSVTIAGADAGEDGRAEAVMALADAICFTRDLVTEPANILYPESFVERARELEKLGVRIEVLDEAEMKRQGFGALLGVAQGSARPPRLLIMEWRGDSASSEMPIAFVGKGVTFDTGGISIKPAAGMEDMKFDMGGAAAVVGAMRALAGRKAKANVVGICGLVENMPSGTAQRPGDVVTSLSGQTIEVINTDAEGRLVLCDAMWYAQERYKPSVVIDLATLTGAIIISLGHEYAGMFTNDDELAEALNAAGAATDDKVWRFPLASEYDKMIASPIADMKNIGGRAAGSITAAQFLKRFVNEGVAWAHLDIAGTVWTAKPGPVWDKGATGYGVRLLDQYVRDRLER